MIGVLGGAGAVGRVVVDRLAGRHELRVGGRSLERAAAVSTAARPMRVDLHDPESLAVFCAGCEVVVNCAGPSYQVLDLVARAAAVAGAHYVDAAGDLVALEALRGGAVDLDGLVSLFSAGLMPGLSGLLPRLLATGPLARLDCYVGGAAKIGELSAVDALLTRGPGFGTPLVGRRGKETRRLAPLREVSLPGFPGKVHAWPFLSAEMDALATRLEVGELRNYTVYVTESIPRALATAWADDGPLERHIPAVIAAAEADLAATGPYYTLLFQAVPRTPEPSGSFQAVPRAPEPSGSFQAVPRTPEPSGARRLMLRTSDSYALSGVVAALAAEEILRGRVEPGAHLAAEALDPVAVLDRLAGDPLVTDVELL